MIYFALYRENQFKHLGPFNSQPLRELLIDRLEKGSGMFRAAALNHFKNLMKRKQSDFNAVAPYLDATTRGKPDRVANHRFYEIADAYAANSPEIVGRLIEQTVLAELQTLGHGERDIWYPKQFANALLALEEAGPEHLARVTKLREKMGPYKDRIVNLGDL